MLEVNYCKNLIETKFNKPQKMTEEDEEMFENTDLCHICEKEFLKTERNSEIIVI